jgi:fumarate reductase subunit C
MKRLIIFILVFAVFLYFIVLNLENKTDLYLGFTKFENIPVFLGILFAFVLGMFVAILLTFPWGKKREKPLNKPSNKPSKKHGTSVKTTENKKENEPYGID